MENENNSKIQELEEKLDAVGMLSMKQEKHLDKIDQFNMKQEKDGNFSEDQSRDEQDAVQKTLDKFIAELEQHLATKEADILKV